MLRKCFLVPVLGSLALLLFVVDVAQAQLRGRMTTTRERRMERRDMHRGVVVTPTVSMTTTVPTNGMSTVRVSNYFTPASEGLTNAAKIRVLLPDAQAKVLFDETATKATGLERLFVTPPLTGTTNTYRIRAILMRDGKEVTLEQVVNVAPGMTYVLDFTKR